MAKVSDFCRFLPPRFSFEMAVQDVIVLCLDVGPSMSLSSLDGGDTALEKSIRVAKQITQQKVWT